MNRNKITTSEWLSVLEKAGGEPDIVPQDWKPAEAVAKLWNKSISRTKAILNSDLCRRGLAESRKFRIITDRGLYPVRHYRVKKG